MDDVCMHVTTVSSPSKPLHERFPYLLKVEIMESGPNLLL